ncbi:hypothetical protein [Streptomyces sp. NPDC089919]|uniref:hypothetical protein n=1 Tax=Streptomyces sp. NPDC089919 TaxID=3155188 RepID=UPI0034133966
MTGAKWDQRAVALVELRGTTTDTDLLEEALAARGWPVLEKRAGPAGPLVDRRGWYVVEVRFPGSSFRAVTGARHRLEALAEELSLDLVVEAVDRVVRQAPERPVWHVARDQPMAWPPLPLVLNRRSIQWRLRRLGLLDRYPGDTGRQVRADSPGSARHLAARPLPGARPTPAGVDVRRSVKEAPLGFGGRRIARSLHFAGSLGLVLGAVGALAIARRPGSVPPELPGLLFLAGVLVAGVGAALRGVVAGARARSVLLVVVCSGTPAGVVAALVLGAAQPEIAARAAGGLGLAYMVLGGLRLLVRQASWRAVVPWLLPALLPFVPGLLPALGLSLPTLYLDAFGVAPEDVEVGVVPELAASLRMLAAVSVWLCAPALLGVLEHCHLMVRARWVGYTLFALCSVYAVAVGAVASVQPAVQAGRTARAAAAAGRTPAPYYGVEPEWVCVKPVETLAKVPVQGGELVGGRAYLLLGDADGTAVLWDRVTKEAVKAPLASLRLVPADDPRRACP